jgi:hypothetical protein
MRFLAANSSAIQAIGALASLFLTFVLVFITWRYVRLTKTLADVAFSQIYDKLQPAKFAMQTTVHKESYQFGLQIDFRNENESMVLVKGLYIWAFYPRMKRPPVVYHKFGGTVFGRQRPFGLSMNMPPGYAEIYEKADQDFLPNPAQPRTYYFSVALNFSDMRGAVQHCCIWTHEGLTMSYQARFYRPPSAFSLWLSDKRIKAHNTISQWKYNLKHLWKRK